MLKKPNLGSKLYVPKSGNRCHSWAVLGPDDIIEVKKWWVKFRKTNGP